MARIANIPLSYPVAAQHKLPLLLPLYLCAPLAVEVHRRVSQGNWADYGIAWNRAFGMSALAGFAVAVIGVGWLALLQLILGWRRWAASSSPPDGSSPSKAALDAGGVQSAPVHPNPGPNPGLAPGPNPGVVLLAVLPLALFVGWIEELIFRGVLVNGLGQGLPVWVVAIAVSVIFAVSHLLWDGPAGAPQLPGLAIMGAVLLLARWATGGSLGLAWGLHAGWVYAIAAIDALALLQPGRAKPVWLVGLPDQPLTGVLPLALLVLTGVGVWVWGG